MSIKPVTPQIATTLPGSLTTEAIAVRGGAAEARPGNADDRK